MYLWCQCAIGYGNKAIVYEERKILYGEVGFRMIVKKKTIYIVNLFMSGAIVFLIVW